MRTLNGIGTMLYGWRHQTDGTAFATKWFVLGYVPLIPLRRYHLRVVTDLRKKESFIQTETEGFLAGTPVQKTHYEIHRDLALSPRDILRTLGRTYLLGPVLMLWPALLMALFSRFMDRNPQWRDYDWPLFAVLGLVVILFANILTVALIALRRARGFQGGLFD
jgi:hypothetical protein